MLYSEFAGYKIYLQTQTWKSISATVVDWSQNSRCNIDCDSCIITSNNVTLVIFYQTSDFLFGTEQGSKNHQNERLIACGRRGQF